MPDSTRLSSRQALIEAAFAVLSRNPSAPLADVAKRAGIGRATLHRYFATRDELVLALARIALVEMDEAAEAACEGIDSWSEALKLTLQALIPLGDRHGFLALEPVEGDAGLRSEYARQLEQTREMIEGAKAEGLFDKTIPTDWIVQAYEHLLYAGWEAMRTESATPAQSAELAWRTLTSGLGGSK